MKSDFEEQSNGRGELCPAQPFFTKARARPDRYNPARAQLLLFPVPHSALFFGGFFAFSRRGREERERERSKVRDSGCNGIGVMTNALGVDFTFRWRYTRMICRVRVCVWGVPSVVWGAAVYSFRRMKPFGGEKGLLFFRRGLKVFRRDALFVFAVSMIFNVGNLILV